MQGIYAGEPKISKYLSKKVGHLHSLEQPAFKRTVVVEGTFWGSMLVLGELNSKKSLGSQRHHQPCLPRFKSLGHTFVEQEKNMPPRNGPPPPPHTP